MKIWIGFFLIVSAILSVVAERNGLKLPTISWGYNLASSTEGLSVPDSLTWLKAVFGKAGEVTAVVMGLFGLFLIASRLRRGLPNPMTVRKIERFKSIKRGYYSFLILIALGGFAALDQLVVGKEALAVKHDGEWTFPAFTRKVEKNKDYGIIGNGKDDLEPDYRNLKEILGEKGEVVVLPLRPYNPTGDTISALAKEISPKEDEFNGLGSILYDQDRPEEPHLRYTYRKGIRQGHVQGWNTDNVRVYSAFYEQGELKEGSEKWEGEGKLEEFLSGADEQEYDVSYPPSDPQLAYPLGTTSQGDDILAYLYGGLQVNYQAALIYIPIVYLIGITVGLLMGYFGGWFDLVVQRLIEVISNIPFLFIVIIITLGIPAQYKESLGFYLILIILAGFGWMGMTYLMRTSALKEKSRDYIAASQVIGAGVPRILFRHLLPNSVAILVTLVPFSVSGIVLSLTALDYLGLGLPPQYASWGKLLKDGLGSLSTPLVVSAAFFCLVTMLVLVTFVGEAIREAFDPKKYTFYR